MTLGRHGITYHSGKFKDHCTYSLMILYKASLPRSELLKRWGYGMIQCVYLGARNTSRNHTVHFGQDLVMKVEIRKTLMRDKVILSSSKIRLIDVHMKLFQTQTDG